MVASTILVVDDEEDTVELAKMVLEHEGYQVFTARNGVEAINLLKSGEEINLILLDVIMPQANGLDVCKWVKKHPQLKKIPVLLFTAKSREKDRLAGEEVGADAYLAKPFSAKDLLDLIKLHIEKTKN